MQLLKESATTLQKSSILTETEIETYNGLLAQLSIKEKDINLAESDIKLFQKLRTITPIIHNFEGLNSFDSLSLGQIAPKFQGFLMVCVLEQKLSGQVL